MEVHYSHQLLPSTIQLSVVKLSIAMIQWRLNTTAVYASHFLQYAGFVRPEELLTDDEFIKNLKEYAVVLSLSI